MATTPSQSTATVGTGRFTYTADDKWAKLPEGWSFVEVVGVGTDRQDRVFVFNRGEHPVIVLDRDGNFLRCWGEGLFARPHGLFVGPDDSVYCTDDQGHKVCQFSPEGKLLLQLGDGTASDTGVQDSDYRTISHGGPPFNLPTNLALAPDGAMYVSDGYGNARVHKFSPTGEHLLSWGEPGSAAGQFNLPHGIKVDGDGKVYVADRENSRIQIFSGGGEFLAEWTDVARPTELFIDPAGNVFVAELGYRAGMFPWMTPDPRRTGGRVSVFNSNGELQARWGGGDAPLAAGDFFAPHDVWADSRGDLYVGEVTQSAGGRQGLVPSDCPSLQKFARR